MNNDSEERLKIPNSELTNFDIHINEIIDLPKKEVNFIIIFSLLILIIIDYNKNYLYVC